MNIKGNHNYPLAILALMRSITYMNIKGNHNTGMAYKMGMQSVTYMNIKCNHNLSCFGTFTIKV